MKIISVSSGIVMFILVLALPAVRAVNPTKVEAVNSKTRRVVNLDTEQLPQRYQGDNGRIVEILKTSYFPKTEFETSDTYAKRTEALQNKLYVFSYKPRRFPKYNGLLEKELSYDAEVKSFKISVDAIKIIEKSWDDVKGSYVGQNAFGAKARIARGTRNRYFINLPEEGFNFELPMEPTKAKIDAENLMILYWVKLRDIECKKDTISPSTDNLFDGGYKSCECHTIPVETWLYNFRTGEILNKVKAEQ